MDIGQKIKNARLSRGYTQEQVAKAINISRSTYAKYELGSIIPDASAIERISQFLGLSSTSLVDGWLIDVSAETYVDLSNRDKLICHAIRMPESPMQHVLDVAEALWEGSTWEDFIMENAEALDFFPSSEMSNSDIELLRAYHSASLEARRVVDLTLEPYKEESQSNTAAS